VPVGPSRQHVNVSARYPGSVNELSSVDGALFRALQEPRKGKRRKIRFAFSMQKTLGNSFTDAC
jgi:hypothetical protein